MKVYLSAVACLLVMSVARAQSDGIGDPTFSKLGNKGYLASHYDLKINYNPTSNLFVGDVKMDAVATTGLKTFSVDFTGFTIKRVRLNGATVPFTRTDAKLRIQPVKPIAKGEKFVLETEYSGNPKTAQSASLPPGMKSGWISYPGGAVAVCEPDLAHTWFPCNDHPLNKATFDVEVTAPSPFVSISNGIGTAVTQNTTHFVLDKPSMTCMVTVAVGKFASIKQKGLNDLPMTNYVPRGTEGQSQHSFDATPKFMKFLADRIGPYPFSSYGVVILPNEVTGVSMLMAAAAIETTSIPVFGPIGVGNPETLCHELTHQWMGDCVSVRNWGDDIWWVEGFAQYSEWLFVEMTEGKSAYDQAVKAAYGQYSAPGKWLKPGHLTAQEMFGAPSYVGGALTYHALRKTLGDVKFYATIKAFIEKNRYGNGSTKDLIEVASKVAGRDMKPFFVTWLSGDTAPKLP